MAKKKKSAKKKVSKSPKTEVVRTPSPIWGYVLAVVFILLGIFMAIGGFGTGGSLPKGLFGAGYWLLGWGAWVVPVSLLYWGAYKFTSEEQRLPRWRVLNMYLLMLFAAAWFYRVCDQTSGRYHNRWPRWCGRECHWWVYFVAPR